MENRIDNWKDALATEFFEALYRGIEEKYYIELRAIPRVSGRKDRIFVNGLDFKKIGRFIRKNRQSELYFGVCTRRKATTGQKSNCLHLPGLWVDADFKNGLTEARLGELIKECPIKPTIIISSGNGCHLYYVFKEFVEASETVEPYLCVFRPIPPPHSD